jgi:hypothetical protein
MCEKGLAPWKGLVYLEWFMNDEHHSKSFSKKSDVRSLEQRLAGRPQVLARFGAIADMLDRAIAEGCTADEAEARAIEQMQALGRALLGDWAQQIQEQSLARARAEHPQAVKHVKKK